MDFIRAAATFIYAVLAGLICAVIGMLVCTGQVFGEYIIAAVQVLLIHPVGLPERAYVFTVPAGGDPAKPNYLFGPARSDVRYIWQVTLSRWQNAAGWWLDAVGGLWDVNGFSQRLTAPIAGGLAVGLVVALLPAALLMVMVWLANEILLDFAMVSARCAVTAFRAIDSAYLSVRHIQVRCISCFERIPYPAYLCPKCKKIHWDIRPGRYGVLRRTCECGMRMPTLLLFGAAEQLEAICPRRACQHPLDYRPGEVQEVILPLFGPKAAGKTLLLWGIVKTLRQSARPGVRADTATPDTATRLHELDAAIAAGSQVEATLAAVLPKAYVLRLRIGRHHRILQLPDPAGELFYDSLRSADLLYLGAASTFILVIDPLSITDFWENLPSARRDELNAHRSTAPHPDQVYQQTADRIAQMGKRHAQRRLAIVFSRADLVGMENGPGAGAGEGVRKWAVDDLGLAGLLRDAESDFREVALFHTAPFGSKENGLDALVHWVMRAEGVAPASLKQAGSLPGSS
jgi:hypothetical protein